MSCVFACRKCGARKRFEAEHVSLHLEGSSYWIPPVTKWIECPCGHTFRVELSGEMQLHSRS